MKKFSLPEPMAVKEVRAWRRKLQRRAEKIGWDKYIAEINARPSLIVGQTHAVVRERPAKKYGLR
jgi:hypothetical protein